MTQQRHIELAQCIACLAFGVLAVISPETAVLWIGYAAVVVGVAWLALWLSGEALKVAGTWKTFVDVACRMWQEKRARKATGGLSDG